MDGVQRMSNTEGHSLYVQVRPMQFHIKDGKMEAEEGDSSVVTQAGCVVTVTSDERRRARAAASVISLLAIVHVVLIYSTEFSLLIHLIVAAAGIAYFIFAFLLAVNKESVLVLGSLGLQLTTTRRCGYTTTVFIPHTIIGDVIINEAVTMNKVVFYLAVMLGEDKGPKCRVSKLLPLFTEFSPRLSTIESIYHEIQNTLFPPTPTSIT